MLKTNLDYVNYRAKIVKLEGLKKHPQADKLQLVDINYNTVITGLDAKDGDIYVYFPLECAINKDFLAWSNSFEDKTLNKDVEKKGFFNKHGRVRAVKLREQLSHGYIIPVLELLNWLKSKDVKLGDWSNLEGIEFDSWNDIIICEKYIPAVKEVRNSGNGKPKQTPKISRLVEGQFKLHNDTNQLKTNLHKFELDDIIGIHYKKHGTSFVCGNVLTKQKTTFWDKLKMFNFNYEKPYVYDIVYSSRKVVKNEFETSHLNGYYKEDIWGVVKDELKDKIPQGFTLYGEIVGYLPSGGAIQSQYDYGCKPNEHKTYIYRITFTNMNGDTYELTDKQIEQFCMKYDLLYKDTFIYYGTVQNIYLKLQMEHNRLNDSINWRGDFLQILKTYYNEKDCYMCNNKVPEEGIVIRKENLFGYEAYKLKSDRFYEYETKELDKEIENIEN